MGEQDKAQIDRQAAEAQLTDLRVELARFERRYAMSSADFSARYRAGEMGDDADVFEWHALYKMYIHLSNAVEAQVLPPSAAQTQLGQAHS